MIAEGIQAEFRLQRRRARVRAYSCPSTAGCTSLHQRMVTCPRESLSTNGDRWKGCLGSRDTLKERPKQCEFGREFTTRKGETIMHVLQAFSGCIVALTLFATAAAQEID